MDRLVCVSTTGDAALQTWMQKALERFLEQKLTVPEPPIVSAAGRQLMEEMQLRMIFLPDLSHSVLDMLNERLEWERIVVSLPEQFRLPGKWVAYEVIPKAGYMAGRYFNDGLMKSIDVESRFRHPYTSGSADDDLITSILPKVRIILKPLGGRVMLQSAEEFNFVGNFLNFLREQTGENFTNLGDSDSWEYCRNKTSSNEPLLVGSRMDGGLKVVGKCQSHIRSSRIAFRFLVAFD